MASFDSKYENCHEELQRILYNAELEISAALEKGSIEEAAGIEAKEKIQEMLFKLRNGECEAPAQDTSGSGIWETGVQYFKILMSLYNLGAVLKSAYDLLRTPLASGILGRTFAGAQALQLVYEANGLYRDLREHCQEFMRKREQGAREDAEVDVIISNITAKMGENWEGDRCLVDVSDLPSTSGSGGGEGDGDGGEEPTADL